MSITVKKSKDFNKDVEKFFAKEMNDKANKLKSDIARGTPVKTGKLKRSLRIEKSGKKIEIGSDAEYASFVEFGTRYQAAQPYFRPAIKKNFRGS